MTLQSIAGTSSATYALYVKLGSTKVYIQKNATAQTDGLTINLNITFLLTGKSAVGASASLDYMVTNPPSNADGGQQASSVAQPITGMATNGTLTLTPGITWAVATTSTDTMSLRTLAIEEIN